MRYISRAILLKYYYVGERARTISCVFATRPPQEAVTQGKTLSSLVFTIKIDFFLRKGSREPLPKVILGLVAKDLI